MRNWLTITLVSLVLVGGGFYWWFRYRSPGRPPVTNDPSIINSNDPRMAAAEAEAKRTWPEFLTLFRDRQPGQHCYVKARFRNGFNFEPLWVEVDAIRDDTIVGSVESKPTVVKSIDIGTPVSVTRADVVDWLFQSNQEKRGGYSIKVIDAIEAERGMSTRPSGGG